MRLAARVVVLVVGLGGCGSNNCDISVSTMTGDNAGHVMLTGDFGEAQPLLNLQSMDGAHHVVVCTVGSDSKTADCDLPQNGIGSGSYAVAFQDSCNDASQDPGTIDIGNGVPATLTVP